MTKIFTCLLLFFTPFVAGAQPNEVREKFQLFADSIQFLELHDFLYLRIPSQVPKIAQAPFNQFMAWSDSLLLTDVKIMLETPSPKIRVLALLALYKFDHLDLLPLFTAYSSDSSRCFKKSPFKIYGRMPTYSAFTIKALIEEAPYLRVSDVVKEILLHFYRQSGYGYDDPEQYLKERANLVNTAGFLNLLKYKATKGIQPLSSKYKPALDKLVARINAIEPELLRYIYQIYISVEDHLFMKNPYYTIYSEAEMIAALKNIGRENTWLILKGAIPANDPDLKETAPMYHQMCEWILLHAEHVFTVEDVPSILQQTERKNSSTFISWYIAAAKLDSNNAAKHLKLGLSAVQQPFLVFHRTDLYIELWRLCKEKEIDFILNWLFGCYHLNKELTERTETFISGLDLIEDLPLYKKIIHDPRFEDSIHIWTVQNIATRINIISQKELIPLKLIEAIWHPYGLDRVEWWRDRALKKYPKETKNLLENTKKLKNFLRSLKL